MKKLYATLLVAILAVTGAFKAVAESVTFQIDEPTQVTLTMFGEKLTLQQGDNVIEYNSSDWATVYINAVDGYRLARVECVSDPGNDLWISVGTSASLYLADYVDGRVYKIYTEDLSAMRTATATVTVVDDYNLVQASRNGSGKFELTGPTTEVKFIPEEESPFTFYRKDYSDLYYVKINGANVESQYGNYFVYVKDGDEIEIAANFPDVDVPVSITIPEDAKGAIESLSVDYNEVDNYYDPDFAVRAGSTITISFDTRNYSIESITVNDEPQYSYYSINFRVGLDPVEIVVDAHPYGTVDFTLNVDDPSKVTVYPGQSTYGNEPFELVAGTNALSVGEKEPYIYVKAKPGYVVNSITDANGNDVHLSYNSVLVKAGDVFNITTGELNYDSKFAFYVDSTDDLYTAYWSDEESRESNYVSAGYTIIPFASDANIMYSVCTSGDYMYYAYKNDVEITNYYYSSYFSQQTYPENGDVYKVFTTGNAPSFHNISFVLSGEGLDDVKVTTDIINERPEFASGLSVLTGTKLGVKLPENDDYDYAVALDDANLEPDENGEYTFDAADDHTVTISSASGISDVAADRTEPAAVYNLQGMKVLDAENAGAIKSLPAGIYITNGKKVVVR